MFGRSHPTLRMLTRMALLSATMFCCRQVVCAWLTAPRCVKSGTRFCPLCTQNPPGMTGADEVINPDNGQPEGEKNSNMIEQRVRFPRLPLLLRRTPLGIACFATEFHARFRASLVNFTQVWKKVPELYV